MAIYARFSISTGKSSSTQQQKNVKKNIKGIDKGYKNIQNLIYS